MTAEPIKPAYHIIDIDNKEELAYIASKLGCSVDDILKAIETLQTPTRSTIFNYLIDKAFKSCLRTNI